MTFARSWRGFLWMITTMIHSKPLMCFIRPRLSSACKTIPLAYITKVPAMFIPFSKTNLTLLR